ncbi:NAD+ synthase [Campylobacter sp. FMV-PI01]|uniref:NH(3)-dependent NAD(+) synthetase n=1 Tax=Campylobacter portucalensis TaxID=2608384 RepID=A0A6L5WM59_9BACT|nr:NAD+ synthase [Campylobacter portucalensis]MSN97085.1 NAD+ synthase [Campylobacter portucalensis]
MNFQRLKANLLNFLKQNLEKTGRNNFIIGISGGLDSAVVSALCSEISNTYGLILPTKISSTKNLIDAKKHCDKFGIPVETIDIEPILKKFNANNLSTHRRGNLMARLRMCALYDYSEEKNAVVVGTSNLSERLLGYGTIYGDLACAFNPIGEIFKTELFEFAKFLDIDENIINKKPSAELFEGQNDEDDLGYSYKKLDEILKKFYDEKLNFKELGQIYDKNLVNFVENRVIKNAFKLEMPAIAKIRSINE